MPCVERLPVCHTGASACQDERAELVGGVIADDCVRQWCSHHGLPEAVANVLRTEGFNTPELLESLRPEDVEAISLPNRAHQCQWVFNAVYPASGLHGTTLRVNR